jgi:hypothetical protein
VALAFLAPQPGTRVVRHLDGDPANNHVSNLAWGTQSENMKDTLQHGTNYWANRTHCPKGHPYEGDNLVIETNGHRRCRTCEHARHRLDRERQAAAEGRELLVLVGDRTHCPQGHPYEGDNLVINSRGARCCRTCRRKSGRETAQRKRARLSALARTP